MCCNFILYVVTVPRGVEPSGSEQTRVSFEIPGSSHGSFGRLHPNTSRGTSRRTVIVVTPAWCRPRARSAGRRCRTPGCRWGSPPAGPSPPWPPPWGPDCLCAAPRAAPP
eukprot:7105221-Pyramimonas_sp.AAC.1